MQSVTRDDEITGGEIDAHFCPELPDRLGWHMSSSAQDLWEVGESPPFVPVKEEGGIYLKICYIHVFQRFTPNNNN